MDAKRYGWGLGLACLFLVGAIETPAVGQQFAPRMASPGSVVSAPTSNAGVLGQRFLVETQHFRVTSQDPEFAKQVATMAEAYRNHLAMHWLGHELTQWHEKVPLMVNTSPNLPASGETKYTLVGGTIRSIQMVVSGTKERILDSVLPHEMTHTVLATHFAASGKPVPRWADEGACTTVEHLSERSKHDVMLVKFLTESRGIPFSHLFAMREYPPDMMPLYAQGYSLCAFLIAQSGPRRFVEFLERGMPSENWVQAVEEVYGYPKLGSLQTAWNAWVYDGGGEVSPYTAVALGYVTNVPKGNFASVPNSILPLVPVSVTGNPPVSIRASQPGPQQTVGGAILR
ncbi:MAG: hypothetical protein NTV29_03220 [Planctomycetota bacterium]|nr:hypothetical protein [Planctomycetota bacterium]